MKVLCGDIGGTNIRLALFEVVLNDQAALHSQHAYLYLFYRCTSCRSVRGRHRHFRRMSSCCLSDVHLTLKDLIWKLQESG